MKVRFKKLFMKIFFYLFILIGNLTFSQNLTANELVNISNMSLEKFDSFINSKNYKYYRNVSDNNGYGIRYRYLSNGIKRYCSLNKYEDDISIVTYQTFSNKDYINLKGQIKNLGYKLTEQGEFRGAPFFEFRKGNNSFTIYLFTIEGINSYEISFSKNY